MATLNSSLPYDAKSATSIFEYSKGLLGKTLRDFVWENYEPKKGKGSLGQMVENIFFFLETNSNPAADFSEAGMELKCTPLKKSKQDEYLIKERLVCNMINYCEVVNEDFEHSHFYLKCQLMLLLFYLHQSNSDNLDLEFIFSVLWKLPEKDLLIIRHDYEVIIDKIKQGKAHELSEGDTEYLGACRKGQTGEKPRVQPFSDILAPKRAFSLKPAYMRTILDYIVEKGKTAVCNFELPSSRSSLFTIKELENNDIESLILDRLKKWYGKSISEIMATYNPNANTEDYAINYRTASAIISDGLYGCGKNGYGFIEQSEEFEKSGLRLKTISEYKDGRLKEHMSYENIDYEEIFSNDNWLDSTTYELFTSRFLFVVFQHPTINSGSFKGHKNDLVLKHAFFWTMPQEDLNIAEEYWQDIRQHVLANEISLKKFWSCKWSEKNNKNFHVRPKGTQASYKQAAENPNGGKADKYCYWFNREYVNKIINDNVKETK